MESTFPMVENQKKHGNINSLSMNVLQHKQTSTKLVANTSSGEEISIVLITQSILLDQKKMMEK